jgi:hypothetical protein
VPASTFRLMTTAASWPRSTTTGTPGPRETTPKHVSAPRFTTTSRKGPEALANRSTSSCGASADTADTAVATQPLTAPKDDVNAGCSSAGQLVTKDVMS